MLVDQFRVGRVNYSVHFDRQRYEIQLRYQAPEYREQRGHSKSVPPGMCVRGAASIMRAFMTYAIDSQRYSQLLPD